DYGVLDTVNGRFDLLVLHLVLLLGRMETDPQLRDAGQGLFDRICTDMDHNLREMGVGDLSVPKHMQRVGEAYYGWRRPTGWRWRRKAKRNLLRPSKRIFTAAPSAGTA